jgi:Na+/glutamate symporter
MILSIIGVAIVSIPSGIIAGGFIGEIQKKRIKKGKLNDDSKKKPSPKKSSNNKKR